MIPIVSNYIIVLKARVRSSKILKNAQPKMPAPIKVIDNIVMCSGDHSNAENMSHFKTPMLYRAA